MLYTNTAIEYLAGARAAIQPVAVGLPSVLTTSASDGTGLRPSVRLMTSSRIRFPPAILLHGTQASAGQSPQSRCDTEWRDPNRPMPVRCAQVSSRCRAQLWENGLVDAARLPCWCGRHRAVGAIRDSADRTARRAGRSRRARGDRLALRRRPRDSRSARRWIPESAMLRD